MEYRKDATSKMSINVANYNTKYNSNHRKGSIHLWLKSWVMPFTLDNWRWGLQEALTISVLMWPCCVPSLDRLLFNGNARWVVASATPVIEGTAGGTTRRMIDRVAGTCIAGLVVVISISITIGVDSQRTELWYCIFALYILISLSGFVYNWLLFLFPTHPLIGITAAFQTPIILSGSVFTGSGVLYATWRAITVVFGVIVSGIISRYFLPRRARVDIIVGLAKILEELANNLEPLIQLESGLVANSEFFQGADDMGGDDRGDGKVTITIETWKKFKIALWERLEVCGKLTNDQLVMVNAARTEVSLRAKNAFFQEEHREALVNIRTLFYHVASIYFLVDTQIAGSTDFEDLDLLDEIQHWSRFGLLDIEIGQVEVAEALEEMNVHHLNDNVTTTKQLATNVSASANETARLQTMRGRARLTEEERLKADVQPTVRWVEVYGPTISMMVKHISKALRAASRGLTENSFPIEAELSMKKAGDAIALFHRLRAERQQATAMFVEYAVHERENDKSPGEDPAFVARFEKMLGVPISDYREFSEEGRAAFWQSYWLLRDRLSTSDTDVMTLFVAVKTAIAAVGRLIQARKAKLSRGEDLHDQLDIDHIEAQQQAAIQKAGGAGAIRGSLLENTIQ